MRNYINAQRIVTETDVEDAEYLLCDRAVQALLHNRECTTIRSGGYLVLDFGKELTGGIVLTTQSVSRTDGKIRMVFGESVMEALSDLGEKNAGNYHSLRDMAVDAVPMSTQRFGDTGFRFVKLEAVGADVSIRTVKAAPDIRNIPYVGSFRCNDELLNTIWETGAYTVKLNMHDYLWDGAKRDRLVWVGDIHPEAAVVKTVFGDDPCVRRSLDLIKQETPDNEWMNGFPTYSFWWIINHYDWYMHWGDLAYLKEQRAYMKTLADKIFDMVECDFTKEQRWFFVDWSSRHQGGEREGVISIACLALDCLREIFGVLHEMEYADRCGQYHKLLQNQKVAEGEPLNPRLSALSVLAGRESAETLAATIQTTIDEMSCFMGYYILNALAQTGHHQQALKLIKEYWGGMLSLGATTFWEEFKPEWAEKSGRIDEVVPTGKCDIHGDFGEHCYEKYRLSLCHGWASGPTAFLMEQIGGVEILQPGCKKLKISPHLENLEWIEISYPTPYGVVEIQAKTMNGMTKTTVSAPKEIEIITEDTGAACVS